MNSATRRILHSAEILILLSFSFSDLSSVSLELSIQGQESMNVFEPDVNQRTQGKLNNLTGNGLL